MILFRTKRIRDTVARSFYHEILIVHFIIINSSFAGECHEHTFPEEFPGGRLLQGEKLFQRPGQEDAQWQHQCPGNGAEDQGIQVSSC